MSGADIHGKAANSRYKAFRVRDDKAHGREARTRHGRDAARFSRGVSGEGCPEGTENPSKRTRPMGGNVAIGVIPTFHNVKRRKG